MDYTEEMAEVALRVLDDRIASQKELVLSILLDLQMTEQLMEEGLQDKDDEYLGGQRSRYVKADTVLDRYVTRRQEIVDAQDKVEKDREKAITAVLKRDTVDALKKRTA